MNFTVVIPARYASTRLPGKPLLDIHGKPMVAWVALAARASRAAHVWVATDDARIASAVARYVPEVSCALTRIEHASGTDRIAEVAAREAWPDDLVVVNVQGDEPHIPVELINQVADLLIAHPDADMATLCTPIRSASELLNPNIVKVVASDAGAALYFSRAPIPWHRDGAPSDWQSQSRFDGAYRHIGLYAYRVGALHTLTALSPSSLERAESLEQLRALQAGLRIMVAQAVVPPIQGVDTPDDIARARQRSGDDTYAK